MRGYVKLRTGSKGGVFFRIEATDGTLLAQSKEYGRIGSAEAGVETLKRSLQAERSGPGHHPKGEVLRARNGQPIGVAKEAALDRDRNAMTGKIAAVLNDYEMVDERQRKVAKK